MPSARPCNMVVEDGKDVLKSSNSATASVRRLVGIITFAITTFWGTVEREDYTASYCLSCRAAGSDEVLRRKALASES